MSGRQISACCEEDYALSMDKRAVTLKLLARQFLTQKSVYKPAVRDGEVNKILKEVSYTKDFRCQTETFADE